MFGLNQSFFQVGDGSRARRRRFDRGSHNGKILRINVDVDPKVDGNVPYKIPADNPFAHQPSTLLPGTVTKPELAPVRMSKSFLNLIFVP